MKHTPQARMRRKLWRGRFKTVLLSVLALTLAVMAFAGPAIAKATLGGGHTLLAQGGAYGEANDVPAESTEAPMSHAEGGHGEAIQLPFGPAAWTPLFIVLAAALVALAFGAYWWKKTAAQDKGSERMQGVAGAIREGALAYLG